MAQPEGGLDVARILDWPYEDRRRVWDAVGELGGAVKGYQGDGVQVAYPRGEGARGGFCELDEQLRELGLVLDPNSLHTFPLGSDNPPDGLRHDGAYPGSRGFWLLGLYVPAASHSAIASRLAGPVRGWS